MVFKNPIGIFGAFNHPQTYDPQIQQHYTRPQLYNDYGSQLPPQQAAAAAQHPMLAPRPVDPATIAYDNVPPQLASASQTQQINGNQFSYPVAQPAAPPPAPPQPPADTWHGPSMGQPGNMPRQPAMTDYSQIRRPSHSNQLNALQRQQSTMQNASSFTSPIGQTAEEYASNLSPLPALNAVSGGTGHHFGPTPQVCKLSCPSSSFYRNAKFKFLGDPALTHDIPLSNAAWAIAPTITTS